MAEGWTRHLKDDCIDACSAGIETHGLNPHAVEVMAEAGVVLIAMGGLAQAEPTIPDDAVSFQGHQYCLFDKMTCSWSSIQSSFSEHLA